MLSNVKYDPIEDTKEYKDIVKELEEKIALQLLVLKVPHGDIGTCHIYWNIKKHILNKDYGIDWKSPAELNSDIIFD